MYKALITILLLISLPAAGNYQQFRQEFKTMEFEQPRTYIEKQKKQKQKIITAIVANTAAITVVHYYSNKRYEQYRRAQRAGIAVMALSIFYVHE